MSRRPIAAERALLAMKGFDAEWVGRRQLVPRKEWVDEWIHVVHVSGFREVLVRVVLVPPNGADRARRFQYVATIETKIKRHPWQRATCDVKRRTVYGPLQTSVIEREVGREARDFAIDVAARHLAYHRNRWAIADARRTAPAHLGRLTERDVTPAVRERAARQAAKKNILFAQRYGRMSSRPNIQQIPRATNFFVQSANAATAAVQIGTEVHRLLAQPGVEAVVLEEIHG